MLKQQVEGPSPDWSKHAIENSLLRERISTLERSADPSVLLELEADLQSLCERCLLLNQVIENRMKTLLGISSKVSERLMLELRDDVK